MNTIEDTVRRNHADFSVQTKQRQIESAKAREQRYLREHAERIENHQILIEAVGQLAKLILWAMKPLEYPEAGLSKRFYELLENKSFRRYKRNKEEFAYWVLESGNLSDKKHRRRFGYQPRIVLRRDGKFFITRSGYGYAMFELGSNWKDRVVCFKALQAFQVYSSLIGGFAKAYDQKAEKRVMATLNNTIRYHLGITIE